MFDGFVEFVKELKDSRVGDLREKACKRNEVHRSLIERVWDMHGINIRN